YVPLDPTAPPERLAFMLADTQAAVLITQKSIYDLRLAIDDLGETDEVIVNRKSKIVNVDADWPTIAQQSTHPPDSDVAPDNLAYVIYTSGSTGRPKGVQISHRSLLNLVFWHRQAFGV